MIPLPLLPALGLPRPRGNAPTPRENLSLMVSPAPREIPKVPTAACCPTLPSPTPRTARSSTSAGTPWYPSPVAARRVRSTARISSSARTPLPCPDVKTTTKERKLERSHRRTNVIFFLIIPILFMSNFCIYLI